MFVGIKWIKVKSSVIAVISFEFFKAVQITNATDYDLDVKISIQYTQLLYDAWNVICKSCCL